MDELKMQALLDQAMTGFENITTLIRQIREQLLTTGLSASAVDQIVAHYCCTQLFKPANPMDGFWDAFGKRG